MSDEQPQTVPSVLLIGGPDAGKSNFLFRFWLAVDAGKGALIKNGFPDELEYLRTGSESLLRGSFAIRTSKEVLEHVTIPVKLSQNAKNAGVLSVPDVPGEKILEIYRLRRWPSLWEDRIHQGSGCLLFVRAASDEVVRPLDYTECLATFGASLPESRAQTSPAMAETSDSGSISGAAESVRVANAAVTEKKQPEPPTDVVLTDWLQFLRRAFTDRVGGGYRPRVGIVVSAWDAVPADAQGRAPVEYVGENFPLLKQFIETNQEDFEFQVFGLSILGGDLKDDAEFKQQFQAGEANKFGYVIHCLESELVRSPDVTLPVAWALGWSVGKSLGAIA